MKYVCVFCIILFTATPVCTQSVSGVLASDETWSGTVSLLGDITVPEGITLNILPGTRIECEPRIDIEVSGEETSMIEFIVDGGTLNAEGTEAEPIVFTSGSSSPERSHWYGIRINTDSAVLKYCTIEYGTTGVAFEGGAARKWNIAPFGRTNSMVFLWETM
ncbi:hypothetical protein GF373_17295 [bacterium]|nr:hypothetical protein [bacterium]